jgi:hypothetical protein
VVAVGAEKDSTLVLLFPVELLRFLEKAHQRMPTAPQQVPQGPVRGAATGAGATSARRTPRELHRAMVDFKTGLVLTG